MPSSTKRFHSLLIFAGLWIATQTFARMCNYSSLLGPCWFLYDQVPVYRPWMLLGWAYKFASWKPVHEYLYKASIWFGVFSAIAVVLYLALSFLRGGYSKNDNLYGTARWATVRDLRRNGLLFAKGVICGQTAQAVLRANASTGTTKYRLQHVPRGSSATSEKPLRSWSPPADQAKASAP